MMKYLLITLLSLTSLQAFSQFEVPPQVDSKFMEYDYIAKYLSFYDAIAWSSSDSIAALGDNAFEGLSRHWFIYQDSSNNFHAVYGKFTDNVYTYKYHFELDTSYVLKRSTSEPDSNICHVYSKAIDYAYTRYADTLNSYKISFNHYLYFEKGESVNVHIIPALQTNAYLIYGYNIHLKLNMTADSLIKDESYFSKKGLRYFDLKNTSKVILDFTETEEAKFAPILLSRIYSKRVDEMKYVDQNYVHLLVEGSDDVRNWTHILRDLKPSKKKSKKKK